MNSRIILIACMGLNLTISQCGGQTAILGTTDVVEQRAAVLALAEQRTATPLKRFQSFNVRGDYVAAGVGMRNRGFGTISITGIPEGSTIKAAYLYWDILANSQEPSFTQGRFNNQPITGHFIGVGEDPCWENLYNFAFRADVTSLVSGNGTYSLSGFSSGITDGRDPWNIGGVRPMVEGASLVIVYENPQRAQTRILIYDGSVETRAGLLITLLIDGFNAPSPVTQARTTFIGADGQSASEPGSTFNSNFLPSVGWDGNDPQAGPRLSNGNLWDTMTVDVTPFIPPGSSSATATVEGGPDCLVWVAQILSLATPSGLDLVDPNNIDATAGPKLLQNDGKVTTDAEKLARAKEAWPITGVVADGVTELLLRIEVGDGITQVTFSLPNGLDDGGLKAIGSQGPLLASVTAPVQTASEKRWAFAVYTSPLNFSRAANMQADREITIVAVVNDSFKPEKRLKLKRPPVVLVHGVWSDQAAWKALNEHLINEDYLANHGVPVDAAFARDVIQRVDYGGQSTCPNRKAAGAFDPMASEEDDKSVVNALVAVTSDAITKLRKRGIAGTQVDVVGHSMGGLVARSRVKANFTPEPYYSPNNFNRGGFHKLITVGTPHLGTPFADFVVRHKSEKLLTTCPSSPDSTSPGHFCCGSQTFEDFIETSGPLGPIGPAIYGFQTASTSLKNIGATPIPSHAIIGIAPDCTGSPFLGRCSAAESWLNDKLQDFCEASARTTVGGLLGGNGNHDTIVPKSSQSGGLPTGATSVLNGLVHASGLGAALRGVGETASDEVWDKILELLRAPISEEKFSPFPASVTRVTSIPWPGCPSSSERLALTPELAVAPATPQTESQVTITPSPGTVVRPGQTVQIAFNVTPGNLLTNGAFFFVGDELFLTEGTAPFVLSYIVPNHAGRLPIFADARYHWTNTYVLVQPNDDPSTLTVLPDTMEFAYFGVRRALRVLGQYPSGLELDLTSAETGTTYQTLSGGNAVLSVSPNGLVEAKGNGQDTILIRNSKRSAFVLVTVKITNHAPLFSPLNDLTLRVGELRELNATVTDPDGNAISLSAPVLPQFGNFADHGDGSSLLRFNPGADYVGTHPVTLVAVDDGDPPLQASRMILVTVLPAADLSVRKSASPDIVQPGSNVVYALSVTNNGPSNAEGVVVTDPLPTGVSFVSASAGCTVTGAVVTCNLGTLTNGANASVTILVTASTAGMLTNTASVASSGMDSVSDNNSDFAITAVVATSCPSVEAIIASINAADLGHRNKRPLIATLQAACSSFDRINAISGANQLHAFQNKVRAQFAPRYPALAEQWTQAAQEIIDSVGGLTVRPRAERMSGRMKIAFDGVHGERYVIEASTNLTEWVTIGPASNDGNGGFTFEDSTDLPYRYYRVSSPQ